MFSTIVDWRGMRMSPLKTEGKQSYGMFLIFPFHLFVPFSQALFSISLTTYNLISSDCIDLETYLGANRPQLR